MRLPETLLVLCLCGITVLGAVLTWHWVFPAFALPRPPGPHPIGTISSTLPGPDGQAIALRIWYPARNVTGSRPAPYLSDGETIEARFASAARRTRPHAFVAAPPASPPPLGWPALLYSPSWDGSLFENTALCEAMASEGFVVIAIARPESADLPPLDFSSEAALQRFTQAMETELRLRTDRLLGVLALLPQLGSEKLLGEKLSIDPQAVGAFGYSFGGAVAAEACRREPQLRGGMNLDGTLFGAAAREGATQPFLFVTDTAALPPTSDLHSENPEIRRNAEFTTKSFLDIQRWLDTRGGWIVRIGGVQHANFSDRPFYSPLRRYTGAGPRDARNTLSVISECATQFFEACLRQKDRPDTWQKEPGVDFQKYPSRPSE